MSDDALGTICAATLGACLHTICLGACYDFITLRHPFTQNLCSCRFCRTRSLDIETDEPNEREPLIHTAEPRARPPMQKPSA
ncbi:hypothetical protein C8Q74DRAFT_1232901 [Fomes fomentarius]|nr:hypothetical protein C8Q74DRAFT_1232901 [Fomes fomentarius]